MLINPIRTIAQREVNDTLTDWRTLTPIFILVFIVPQILIFAAVVAIDFIGDAESIIRLIPFAMLLVGFIPASFSLISALESFVGERERNSLEALLAMPVSDNQLYLGKLIASLLPPLLSSCLAMCIFAVTLRIQHPQLFFQGLTFQYFVIVLLLIVSKAVAMVSAAVIISTHTTSVRAANLLSSFVLLPTAAIVQMESLLVIAVRWDVLQLIVIGMSLVAVTLARTGMGTFNREEILSREHEQINVRRILAHFLTFLREFQPAGVPLERYRATRFSLQRFYLHEFPAILREYRLPLLLTLVPVLAGLLFGHQFARLFNQIGQSPGNVGIVPEPNLLLGLWTGAANAIRVLITGLFAVMSFGIGTAMIPFFAFGGIGYVAGTLAAQGGSWFALGNNSPLQFVIGYVLPHGIFELPAALLGSAMGLRIGTSMMAPPRGFSVGDNILWSLAQFLKVWLLVILPAMIIAGLVQQLISTRILAALYGA